MILVVLGTEKYDFTRPLIAIEDYIEKFSVEEKIIVQGGYTKYKSTSMEITPFFNMTDLDKLYMQARFIISHGGTGSIITGIKKMKKVIVIPRLKKFDEHIDDHQLELVDIFQKQNYILPWTEDVPLNKVVEKIPMFQPAPFVSGKIAILDYVKRYINNLGCSLI